MNETSYLLLYVYIYRGLWIVYRPESKLHSNSPSIIARSWLKRKIEKGKLKNRNGRDREKKDAEDQRFGRFSVDQIKSRS